MATEKKENSKKVKLWQYALYACFLIFGTLLIVIPPIYMRRSGGIITIKALDDMCKTYDISMNAWICGIKFPVDRYLIDSETPAKEIEAFIFDVPPESRTLDKLQLSSEENVDFELLIEDILDDYGPKLFHELRFSPRMPYRWKLIEKPSGEHLAIWYQDEDENLPDIYGKEVGKLHLISW